jgi:hypothetical protein
MITFRCTQKVRDLLRLPDRDLADETDSEMEEWFVETATIERYRCLLFTHKLSLYSFWAVAVRKADLLVFDELFRHHALAMLKADGFTDAEVARLLPAAGHRFAKTNSRPVTGSMNNHVAHSRWYFEHDGGIKVADVRAINRQLNRTPMGALAPGSHMDFPIDVLTRIIRPLGSGVRARE